MKRKTNAEKQASMEAEMDRLKKIEKEKGFTPSTS